MGSKVSFEIVPRCPLMTRSGMADSDASDHSLRSVGVALRDALAHLNAALGDVAYNLGFHTAPHQHTGQYHWHAHVWPNLVTQAGFERGTGVMINVVPPEQASETLRSVTANA